MKKEFINKVKVLAGCMLLSVYSHQVLAQPRALPAPYPSGAPVNFVRTWDAMAPEQDPNILAGRPLKDIKQATQYFDGLGRTLQTVMKQGSMATGAAATDMVSPVEYDVYGREQHKYLPFAANTTGGYSTNDGKFKLNPFQQQEAFMTAQYSSQSETFYYSKTNFEASPLNRVTESYAPGNSWVGSEGNSEAQRRNVQMKYYRNTATDAVRIWTVTDNTPVGQFETYATTAAYPAGELYKNIIVDEHKKQVIEFIDKEGKVILKKVQLTATADDGTGSSHADWLCTYYIYDDFENLRCIIQPEGVKAILTNWVLTSTLLAEQCFRYEYDERKRMIMKKTPGEGEVWIVYDARDRIVMTQNAIMRTQQKWMYTTYDELNRLVSMGLMSDPANYNNLTAHLNSAYNSITYPNLNNYTYEEVARNFYNDYSWLNQYGNPLSSTYSAGFDSYFQTASNTQWPYAQSSTPTANLKGVVTGSRIKVLGTSTYLYSVSFYDEKGQVIQMQATNITGGIDIITTQYTWAGQPLVMVQKQEKQGTNTQTTVVVTQITYDDLGRLIKVEKKQSSTLVNNNAMSAYKTISQSEYNQSGQLRKKTLGNNLETLTYDYNIRGWFLGANRDYAKDVNNNNYFGFDLGYDKANNGIVGNQTYATPQYNGNIEGITWKSKGDGEKRKYDFGYDAASRLLKANFTQYTGGSFNQTAGINFDVKMGDDGNDPLTAYDANGNIKRMQQWGLKVNTSAPIDDLVYEYGTNSNKLLKVTDTYSDPTTKLGDFKDGGNTGSDYSYDVNGNMVIDLNKNIAGPGTIPAPGITYNHLNLPTNILVDAKGSIEYVYDAGGNKLKKIVHENNKPDKTTLYIGGMVYEDDVLQFAGHEEGRIRFKPARGNIAASFEYDYMLKDHLSNVRMVLTEEQQQDIYPGATLEPALTGVENTFYTIDQSKIVPNSAANYIRDANQNSQTYPNNNGILNNNPSCTGNLCTNDNSQYVYQLNSNTNKTGLGITLKVMAGDKLDILGKSYYHQNNPGSGYNNTVPIIDLLTGFLNSPGAAASTHVHGVVTPGQINTTQGTAGINSMMNSQNSQSSANPLKPKAFINCIIFDEQFKAVDFKISMVGTNSELKNHYPDLQNIIIPKNGFVYIYCSNETPVNVFFDNIQLVHTRGQILEETHYYPFGLVQQGISSKAAGMVENRAKFNGSTELNNDFDISFYETEARSYDPQIGRFLQIDPLADAVAGQSSFVFADNNPILLNDPTGLASEDADDDKKKKRKKPKPATTPNPKRGKVVTVPGKTEAKVVPPVPTIWPNPAPPPPASVPTTPKTVPTPGPGPAPASTPLWLKILKPVGLTLSLVLMPTSTGAELSPMESSKRLWDLTRYDPYPGYGNEKANTNNHIVYSFTFSPVDGKTPVIKYGISDEFRNGIDRPERQFFGIQLRWGFTVKMNILARTINREQALFYEQQLVNQHLNYWRTMPREQVRPFPN